MKKIFLPIIGLGAIIFAMGLNLRYAANDYGILENTLSFQVTAQASTSNGSNSNSNSNSDGGGNSSGTKCPDHNYVPNRYIRASYESKDFTTNNKGQVDVLGTTLSGYEKNSTVTFVIVTKNCDGTQEASCCDQRQVGVSRG